MCGRNGSEGLLPGGEREAASRQIDLIEQRDRGRIHRHAELPRVARVTKVKGPAHTGEGGRKPGDSREQSDSRHGDGNRAAER